ncbi:Solute carrier organic anion transporter family member 1C1-like protein [Leptotrombidium deliense]|uniref:Solute carrier organic anion transporter family member n=1 Tax=Leptotrombidium deliense TaxID=299467 RepID=A0A443SMX4_9ACAR|nr:Solute carrier organic anion transporter family member 1C1-like protein [Leptotrombidium deliense]
MKDEMAKVDESEDVHLMRNGTYKLVSAADGDLDTEERSNGKYEYDSNNAKMRFATEEIENRVMDACQPMGKDYSCGLWVFRPRWLQRFANKQAFLVTFCLTSVLQGMYHTYFVSVLTTIEKLYQIQSTTTGIILSATEIGQIGGVLLLTYYGGRGHRPKWIACGTLVFALASIISSSPHFLFSRESFSLLSDSKVDGLSDHHLRSKLCVTRNSSVSQLSRLANMSVIDENHLMSATDECLDSDRTNQQLSSVYFALPLFFITRLLIGIGSTAVTTLGIPYIDDNVAPKESPLYFGITIGVRIFGPVFGFLLGALCTGVHVGFPFTEQSTAVTPNDPQWIGAWWLGVVIVGISLLFTSIIMMAFPRKLPRPDPSSYCHQQRQNSLEVQRQIQQQKHPLINGQHSSEKSSKSVTVNHTDGKPNLKDFPSAMKRLLKNEVLILRTASSVLHILPIAGVYTFLPKFLESQFQLTAGQASVICGIAGVLVMGVGIFASGIFMKKFKPSPRFVAKWIAFSALLYAFGMIILMFLGCPLSTFVGLNSENMESSCGEQCSCPKGEYSPVCVNGNITYVSPCLAGCRELTSANDSFSFSKCDCLTEQLDARNGPCPLNCGNLVWYTLIFAIFVLVHSTSEVGSMLLTLRCVEPEDKAMALGLISFAIGLFGNVPCPIIYGAVVDSACLFWEYNCGKPGACRVYDPSKFRLVFHGLTAFIMFIAFIVDSFVWYKAPSITFHTDENNVNVCDQEEDMHSNNDDHQNEVIDKKPQNESCV